MSRLYLFDIDGVLADDTKRLPFALERDWRNYFKPEVMWHDTPLKQGFDLLLDHYRKGDRIAFLTGRRGDLRWATLAWLNYHWFQNCGHMNIRPFEPESIYMRPYPEGYGTRPVLAQFKESVVRILDADARGVTLYEDDPEVVRHIKENFGEGSAIHCTWYVKQPALVKKATA